MTRVGDVSWVYIEVICCSLCQTIAIYPFGENLLMFLCQLSRKIGAYFTLIEENPTSRGIQFKRQCIAPPTFSVDLPLLHPP